MKRIISLIIVFMLAVPITSFAHSGGTDANGGHHDYNNVSGLGSYHYHHGYGPHLHPGGVCPYGGGSSSATSSNNNSSGKKISDKSSSEKKSSSKNSSSKPKNKKIRKIQRSLDYPVIYNVLSHKKRQLTIYWEADPTADGYKVIVARDSKYTKGVKSVIIKRDTVKKTFKKLKSGEKYYVKIISFKKYKGKRIYSLDYDFMGPVRVK